MAKGLRYSSYIFYFAVFTLPLVVCQVKFTTSYRGGKVTGVLGSSFNFTWTLSGNVQRFEWGTAKGVNNLDEVLVSIDKSNNVNTIGKSSRYYGRVSGVWDGRNPGQVTYMLNSINMGDERSYACRLRPVSMFDPYAFDKVRLLVSVAKPTLEGGQTQYIARGSRMYLTCRYSPLPPVSKVQWIKDGIVITQNTTVLIKDSRMNITKYNETQTQLSITKVTAKDAGKYVCNVTYDSDSASETKIVFIGTKGEDVELTCRYNGSIQTQLGSICISVKPEVVIVGDLERFIAKGDDVELTCRYNASPLVSKVQWIKNGTVMAVNTSVLISDARVTVSGYNTSQAVMSITAVTQEDSGNYTCRVTNHVDSTLATTVITIEAKPSITTFPQSVTIREGENVTLQCNATGGSSLEISWSFRGSLMMKNGGVGNILTLSIVNVNRKYGGDYRCVVRSRIGNNTSTSTLNVQFAPEILNQLPLNTTRLTREGYKYIVFSCTVVGNPPPLVYWTKNGLILNVTANPRLSAPSWNSIYSLNIINVSRSDAGQYRCLAINSVGNSASHGETLKVFYVPKITVHPQNITTKEGGSLSIYCNATGNPDPTVSWTKDGSLIRRNLRIAMSADNKQLTITNAAASDSGEYRCTAVNSIGKYASIASTVIVQSAPKAPKYVRVVSKSSRVVNISWTAGFNGNSAITNYTVEISEHNQMSFRDAACQGSLSRSSCVISSPFTSASLYGLLPWTTYFVRVFARNMVGSSIGSSLVNVTTNEEEPTAAPTNVRGHNTSSTSILVEWGDVPAANRNGIILTCTITYHSLIENDNGSKTVDYVDHQVNLTSLKEFVNYSITVFASTAKGHGPLSNLIVITTDQDRPSAAPLIVKAIDLSSTSIIVYWDEVPAQDQNGIILTYTITYQSLTEHDNGHFIVDYPEYRKELIGLKEYVYYKIKIFASTEKGRGPDSNPISVRTDQDKPSGPPAYVRVYSYTTSILVMWDEVPADDQNGVITGYTITYYPLPQNHSGLVRAVNSSQHRITLKGLIASANYSIRVLASTLKGDGPSSNPIVVTTLQGSIPPRITIHPESQTKPEGRNVTLSCYADGNPEPTISWTKNGSRIQDNPRIRFSVDNKKVTIRDVRRTDRGQYRCVAYNKLGKESSRIALLTIQFAPEITKIPKDATKKEGQKVIFSCSAIGNPQPIIHWTKDGIRIYVEDNPRFNVSSTSASHRLTIMDIRQSDAGKYRCVAENSVDSSVSSAATLTVASDNSWKAFLRCLVLRPQG
ncbi:Down syndrome cell adhesion molecule-like [Stylophora pistillata]|uniref:Down syndrome cell adhesion molecule-like n=1 Tax=Stylophora pistillata TaxID=50429 RepID=A0A2B4RCT9_STYPI|nr:Down syndrome cell adhesion molecule-like [Stylophora pistillata]